MKSIPKEKSNANSEKLATAAISSGSHLSSVTVVNEDLISFVNPEKDQFRRLEEDDPPTTSMKLDAQILPSESHASPANTKLDQQSAPLTNATPSAMAVNEIHPVGEPTAHESSRQQNALETSPVEVIAVAASEKERAVCETSSLKGENRLTFSVNLETQDLLELSADLHDKDYTQKQFSEMAVAAEPSSANAVRANPLHLSSAASPFRRVIFCRKGRLIPYSSHSLKRVPVPFRLLGGLRQSSAAIQADHRATLAKESCDQGTQTDSNLNSTLTTPPAAKAEVNSKAVQTDRLVCCQVGTQTCKIRLESVEIQTDAVQFAPLGTETENPKVSACSTQILNEDDLKNIVVEQDSVPLNSLDFLLPTFQPKTNVKRPTVEEVIQIPSCSQETDLIPCRQPKRTRKISSDSESGSQEAKRLRDQSPDTVVPVVLQAAADVHHQTPPKSSACYVIPATPKTSVVESDAESEDIFTSTPDKRDANKKTVQAKKEMKPVLVTSGLPRPHVKVIEDFSRQFGVDFLTTYTNRVTHVVVRVDEDNMTERTLKYLYGVAGHKWIVNVDWVRQCLKEKRFVGEEPYEVLEMEGEDGPRRSRHSRTLLFQDFEFCCLEPFTDVTVDQLREILHLCGAKTVESPTELTRSRRYSLVVMQTDTGGDQKSADIWFKRYQVLSVSREWVLDCVAGYSLYPIRSHLIGDVSGTLLRKMGFPQGLID